jgi:hypothetical protein
MAEFALVVVAYNRPKALSALLQSLNKAVYHVPVDIVFCLEHDAPENVLSVVNTFTWSHGEVTIAESAEFLGLRKQMIRAFSMAANYSGIVVLEDDVQVAPGFFAWFSSWFEHLGTDPQVAGCALYHQHFHYLTEFPFWPMHDGSDHYFLQVPCSWGTGHTKGSGSCFS